MRNLLWPAQLQGEIAEADRYHNHTKRSAPSLYGKQATSESKCTGAANVINGLKGTTRLRVISTMGKSTALIVADCRS